MEGLKKARRPLRSQITRKIQEINDELGRDNPDGTCLTVKVQMLTAAFEKLDVLDDQIIETMRSDGSTEEEEDAELLTIEDYKERYLTIKTKVDFALNPVRDAGPRSSRSNSPSASSVGVINQARQNKSYKLPKIEIKKFDGELKNWLSFWAQFEKIHNDVNIHDADKFQYLVQSMLPGTRAAKLVNGYPQTEANYGVVIHALRDRFGDKVLLTEMYVRELLRLVVRNAHGGQGKALSLSTLYDEIESHLRALESLEITFEHSSAFLYPLVESSLPMEIIQAWQRSSMSGYSSETNDTPVDERLRCLMKFLRQEVKGAERLSYVTEGFADQTTAKRHKERKSASSFQPSLPTAAGLFVGSKLKSHQSCIFCDKSHESENCINAQTMAFNAKKKKIIEHKACMLCLRVGHVAKACKAYLKCIVCSKRHVTLMCPDLESNRKVSEETKVKTTENVPEVHSNLNCTNEVLLQTLRCVIGTEGREKVVRVLLDPGSQKSYILEKTAHGLNCKPEGEVQLRHLLFGGLSDVQSHKKYSLQLRDCNAKNQINV